MTVDVEWITRELRNALRSLAADGSRALDSLPDGCVKADELALDYDHFLRVYLENVGDAASDAQRAALLRTDRLLSAMSGAHQAELWTREAVRDHPRWSEVGQQLETHWPLRPGVRCRMSSITPAQPMPPRHGADLRGHRGARSG